MAPLPRSMLALALPVLMLHCAAATRTESRAQPSARTPWHPRSGPTIEQLINVHRATAAFPARDGHLIAFLSDAPGTPQPFYVDQATAPASETAWHRVARFDDRTDFVALTPDDRTWLLGHDHGGDENVQLFRLPFGTEHPEDLSAHPASKYQFGALSRDGRVFAYASNERSPGDFDVYVRAVDASAPPRRVLEAHGHFGARDFSPDGQVLLALEERSNFDQDLHQIDLATGATRLLTAHHGDERFDAAQFGFEGVPAAAMASAPTPIIFALSDRGREFMNLGFFDEQGFHFTLDEPHDMDFLAVSPATNVLAVATNIDGFHRVRFFSQRPAAHPTELGAVDLPPIVITSMRFSADGRTLVIAGSRASVPDEIYRVDVSTRRAERVTRSDHAGLDESQLVEPEVVRIASFDGLEIPLLIYRPRDLRPGTRAPVVVSVHGGPESQAAPYFSPVTQYLVGHGYIVVTPNVRGSTGYGKRYAHLDDRDRREDSVRDLSAVNQWLRHQPDVDPTRLAIMGGSYGGYMTLAAITLYPDQWSAACDIVGIANFRTFLERTAPYRRALREAEYGSLANDGPLLDRISPLHHVDRIRTPLMVIHGTNDPRVPVNEAEQIVNALRGRGQRVEYLRFDNEGHGLTRRENRLRGYGEMVRFFDDVLGASR